MELTDVIIQMVLTDICKMFIPKTKEYSFFSVPHGTFSKIDHILGHKVSLNTYKNWNNPCTLPYHHGLKLEFNSNVLQENYKCLETKQQGRNKERN